MLYPKIKKKKKSFKLFLIDRFDDVKIAFFKVIKIILSKDHFVLFLKKSFHI